MLKKKNKKSFQKNQMDIADYNNALHNNKGKPLVNYSLVESNIIICIDFVFLC